MKRVLFLFLLVLFAGETARAADAVLKAVAGDVLVRTGSVKFKPAKKGMKLASGAQIKTGEGGLVRLAFKSGAVVIVKERSQFSLKSARRGDSLSFTRGEFLIGLRKKLKAGRRFTVKTPACVAAVRGTLFWGFSDDDKSSTYACFTGAIDVSARSKSIALAPGEKTRVALGEAPEDPRPSGISPNYIKTFSIDDDLGGVDQILKKEAK